MVDGEFRLHPTRRDTVVGETMSDQSVEDTTATHIAQECSRSQFTAAEEVEDSRSDEICSDAGTLSVATFFNGDALIDQNLGPDHFNYQLPFTPVLAIGSELGTPSTGPYGHLRPSFQPLPLEGVEALSDHMFGGGKGHSDFPPRRRGSAPRVSRPYTSYIPVYSNQREKVSPPRRPISTDGKHHYAETGSSNVHTTHRGPSTVGTVQQPWLPTRRWEADHHESGRARSAGRWLPKTFGGGAGSSDWRGGRHQKKHSRRVSEWSAAHFAREQRGSHELRSGVSHRSGYAHHDPGRRGGGFTARRPHSRNYGQPASSRSDVVNQHHRSSTYSNNGWREADNQMRNAHLSRRRPRNLPPDPAPSKGPLAYEEGHRGVFYPPGGGGDPHQRTFFSHEQYHTYNDRRPPDHQRFVTHGAGHRSRHHHERRRPPLTTKASCRLDGGHNNFDHSVNYNVNRRPRQGSSNWGRGGRGGGNGAAQANWRGNRGHVRGSKEGSYYETSIDGGRSRQVLTWQQPEKRTQSCYPERRHDRVPPSARRNSEHQNAGRRRGGGSVRRCSRVGHDDCGPVPLSLDTPPPYHGPQVEELPAGPYIEAALSGGKSGGTRGVLFDSSPSTRRTVSDSEEPAPWEGTGGGNEMWRDRSSTTVTEGGTLSRWPSSG